MNNKSEVITTTQAIEHLYTAARWIMLPKRFLQTLTTKEALVLAALIDIESMKKPDEMDDGWFVCPPEKIRKEIGLRTEEQRKALTSLTKMGLVKIKTIGMRRWVKTVEKFIKRKCGRSKDWDMAELWKPSNWFRFLKASLLIMKGSEAVLMAYYINLPRSKNGEFFCYRKAAEREIGLDERTQQRLTKSLKKRGYISIEMRGYPRKRYMRLDVEKFHSDCMKTYEQLTEEGFFGI